MTSPSERNKLRHFADLDDLFDNNNNDAILEWVNELVERRDTQREQGKRYRQRQQAFVKVAKQMLDSEEVKELNKKAVGLK